MTEQDEVERVPLVRPGVKRLIAVLLVAAGTIWGTMFYLINSWSLSQ